MRQIRAVHGKCGGNGGSDAQQRGLPDLVPQHAVGVGTVLGRRTSDGNRLFRPGHTTFPEPRPASGRGRSGSEDTSGAPSLSSPRGRMRRLHGVPELAWWWYPILFVTGLAAGFVDAIAGGGGLLTLPVLFATGMDPRAALGTNKFQSSCGTTVATWQYARHGLLKWAGLRIGILATLSGAIAGAWVVTRLDRDLLRPVVPVLLASIAVYTWLKPDLGREARPPRLDRTLFAFA